MDKKTIEYQETLIAYDGNGTPFKIMVYQEFIIITALGKSTPDRVPGLMSYKSEQGKPVTRNGDTFTIMDAHPETREMPFTVTLREK